MAVLIAGSPAIDVDLQPATAAAFDRYVRLTEQRLHEERLGNLPFLWIDRLSQHERQRVDEALRRGEIVVERVETLDAGRRLEIENGICHHWAGTVFVPGTKLGRLEALMQAYDRYEQIYAPAVRRSRTIAREGDRFHVYLQLYMHKIISVVLNTEYDVRYVHITPTRAQVQSVSTRVAEVIEPDTPEEHEQPIGHDDGFLWRFNNYCALEEHGDGTYVQCESISLSRSIPNRLGWLIGPMVSSIPRDSLAFTLEAMRRALKS